MSGQIVNYLDVYLYPKIKMIRSLIQELLLIKRFIRSDKPMSDQAYSKTGSQTLPFIDAWLDSG